MSKSRYDNRRTSNMSVKRSPSANEKIRKPLKCKKNIHTTESRKKSLERCKSVKKNVYCEINEKPFLSSPKKSLRSSPRLGLLPQQEKISISGRNMLKSLNPKFKTFDSVEIDALSNFTKSNKRTSSSSRKIKKFQPAGCLFANENISIVKSQEYKKNLDKLSVVIDTPLILNKSSCKTKRQSFYRQSNLIMHHCENPKSKISLNDTNSKVATPRISELTKDSLRLKNGIVFRSTEKHKRTSNDMLLSKGLEMKEIRKSTPPPKNQRENTKGIKSLSSKLETASVQKIKERNSVSSHTVKPETDINYKALNTTEIFTRSSRSSMTLRSSDKSEKPSRNRISLRTRHNSKKTSNLLFDEMPHTANREQIKNYTVISKEQKKENIQNVKTTNKDASLAKQETEMLVHKHKRSYSTSKHSLKSKNDKCFNEKDPQTPKMSPSTSPNNNTSSSRKSLRLFSKKSSEKTISGLKVGKCADVIEERQNKTFAVSSKKQKAEVKGKKTARKRPSSSSSKTNTPIQKKRKLSVQFKKQTRPRSFSATIPIDDLALTPAMARKTKSDGFNMPGRNTLKRKRFVMDEIKKADDGYEDDIYESKTFDHFKYMFPDSSDSSEFSCSVKTPKLASLLTPGIHCKTPAYKDCYSPAGYALNRKIAEEYIYRTRKEKRTSQVETPDAPEKKKLDFNKVVEKAYAVQKEVEKLTVDSSDEEDLYFTEDM